ncbi:YceI family protein [Jiulongibacter sp. NS-SX5]|uniref:YceI family protein n=1 Tax=Jiulongibacter sp. NS-SX5 TaxID=3463854 RepID=UPI00405882A6
MKKLQLILVAFLLVSTSIQAQEYKAVSGIVNFNLKMLGATVNGSLKGMKVGLKFENGEPQSISASVASSTIDTDNSLRDRHLKEKDEFFEVKKYPRVSMASVGDIKKLSSSRYEASFKVKLKDKSKLVKVPFTITENGNKLLFKADFTIDRTDWDFGGNSLGMGDDVNIKVSMTAVKQ